jgi:hypothetical protein
MHFSALIAVLNNQHHKSLIYITLYSKKITLTFYPPFKKIPVKQQEAKIKIIEELSQYSNFILSTILTV